MASSLSESCQVCMTTACSTDRQAVALPCGHDFCFTCLKEIGRHLCSKCRGGWTELGGQARSKVAEGVKASQKKEKTFSEKLREGGDRCRNHLKPYDFWSKRRKQFYCAMCIDELDLSPYEMELIDESVAMIKSDISDKVTRVNKQLKKDLQAIDDFHNNLRKEINCVGKYREAIQKVEEKLKKFRNEAEALKSQKRNDSVIVQKLNAERVKIRSKADSATMESTIATLDTLVQPCCLPALQDSESLLCNVACAYVEREVEKERPSSSAFVNKSMKATDSPVHPLAKAVLDSDDFKDGDEWSVDNNNCLAVLVALAERQPSYLSLIARHDDSEHMDSAAVGGLGRATTCCAVSLKFYCSLCQPEHHNNDQEFSEHFLGEISRPLISFYGHLSAAGIAKLPPTIRALGLAISSRADATAVSGLKPWKRLEISTVSVSRDVAACDLSQLPSVSCVVLFFPGLTDARVDCVRPAIEALVRDLELDILVFPLSQLTAAGLRRLVQQLRGVRTQVVCVESCGSWQPGGVEILRIRDEISSSLGGSVFGWDMDFLYLPRYV